MTTTLTVVIPTYNEIENVDELIRRLDSALKGIAWEAVFVDDDSPDGTAQRLRQIGNADARIRCLHRIGRRGLSRAVVEGVLACSSPYIAVMDADLQHDETRLPLMLTTLRANNLDVVIGSRYCEGGGTGQWDATRGRMSAFATRLSRWVVSAGITDPMSGYFLITRPAFERSVRQLSGEGYKILLDLFASTKQPYRFAETPYTFAERVKGESKLDSAVMWEYLMLLLDKNFGRWIPPRFLLFCVVGLLGLGVHLFMLSLFLKVFNVSFAIAQATATITAMTGNFALNNVLTYRDRRLQGWNWLTGLMSFYLLCGLGFVANVGVANFVFERPSSWWTAGLAGAIVGSLWNYAATALFTWGRKK